MIERKLDVCAADDSGYKTGLGHIDAELQETVEKLVNVRNRLTAKLNHLTGVAEDVEDSVEQVKDVPRGWPHSGQLGDVMRNAQNLRVLASTLMDLTYRLEREV